MIAALLLLGIAVLFGMTLPSGAVEMPFNIQNPRYQDYHRAKLGFPQIVWQTTVRSYKPQEQQAKAGSPENFMDMARGLRAVPIGSPVVSAANVDFIRGVPYRQLSN